MDLSEFKRSIETELVCFDFLEGKESEGHGVYAALDKAGLKYEDGWGMLGPIRLLDDTVGKSGLPKAVAVVVRLDPDEVT